MSGYLTEKQQRGFELVVRAIRKKFPYITFVKIDEISSYHIWIKLGVEMLSFLKYHNVPPPKFHLERGVENARRYFKTFPESGFLFSIVDESYSDEYSIEYNEKMENLFNGLYNSLPEDYQKMCGAYTEHPIRIGIGGYVISVSESGDFPTPTKS